MKKILAIFLIILSSCSTHDDRTINRQFLSGTKVSIAPEASLFDIVYADDTVLVAGLFGDVKRLVAFGLDDQSEAYEFLNVGRGPFEVNYSKVKSHKDTIYVMSHNPVGLLGMIVIPINGIHDKSMWKYSDYSDLNGMQIGGDFDVISSSEYVILGENYNVSNVLSIVGKYEGSYKKAVGFWPDDRFSGGKIPKQLIYMGASKIFYNKGKLLYACSDGRYVSILDISSYPPMEIPVYDEFPIYAQASDGLNPKRSSKSKRGVYAYATDSLIYISPLECLIRDGKYLPDNYKGYPAYYNDEIEVYDWNGEYRCTYVLDKPFCNFYVCDNDRCMYVMTIDKETLFSEIYKYDFLSN